VASERPRVVRARPDADTLAEMAAEVRAGLRLPLPTLPCKYFYDERGSALFDAITRLPEYYPTRTEAAILAESSRDMAEGVPDGSVLIEFGSGSSRKTELLLQELPRLRAYVMIDVSKSALDDAKSRLVVRFPALDVRAIVADFSYPVALPADLNDNHRAGFFPGSTIGNLNPVEAQRLLRVFRAVLSPGSRLIVGVDLKKDLSKLLPAYNDAAGITAAFNLNLLARINREITPAFDLDAFGHEAIYNSRDGRIEMHLVSLKDQDVVVGRRCFHFRHGETIHTENSYKYTVRQFQDLARAADWRPSRIWTDREGLFSVHELVCV
jgi:dimethylhistidine N-methyltransferase